MTINFKEELEGERIILRATHPTEETVREMFATVDANREHLRPWLAWVDKTQKADDTLKYLCEKEEKTKKGEKIECGIYIAGEYAGNIAIFDLSTANQSGEIGYWISSQFGRKGYMTEAVKVMEEEFFQHLNRIQLKCDERNIASRKVIENCGYTLEGVRRQDAYSEHFKDFRNTLVFSKLKSEYSE